MSAGLLLVASLLFARLPFADQMQVEQTAVGHRLVLGELSETVAGDDPQALALAWMRLADRRAGWSDDPRWWRLNRWSNPMIGGPRADNLSPRGFAHERGRASPAEDFASFAAVALLEPRDRSNARIACRLRSQWRYLREALASLPRAAQPVELPDDAPCPAFRRWADPSSLTRVELVLAAPSTASVGSMFGHLVLRLVRDDGSMRDHEMLAFLAENDRPFEADPFYVVKGLTGVYAATLTERSLVHTLDEYLVREGRDLERFALHLTGNETQALLDRLWTARQAMRLPYYFLQDNCATMLIELLRDVLDDDATFRMPDLLGAGPTGALDALALVTRADGGPLLTPIFDTFTSLHREAVDAAAARNASQKTLLAAHPKLKATFAQATSADPHRRAQAIDALGEALKAEPSEAVDEWLAAQATIELHLSRSANAEEEKQLNEGRLAQLPGAARTRCAEAVALDPSLSEAARSLESPDRPVRLSGFTAFAHALPSSPATDELRRCAALHLILQYGDRLQDHPDVREPLFFVDPKRSLEDQDWAQPIRTLVAWQRVTRLTPGLASVQQARRLRKTALGSLVPMTAINEARRSQRASQERTDYERGWPHTGIDGTTIGVVMSPGRWALQFGGAIYDERLGDRRRHGFPGHTAFTFLDSSIRLGVWEGSAKVIESRMRLVGWRSITPALAEQQAPWSRLGWDVFVDLDASLPRRVSSETRLGAALLVPVAGTRDATSHLLLRAGGDWSATFGARLAHGPAGAMGVEARWTPDLLGGRHWLETQANGRLTWDFSAGAAWWHWEAKAAVSLGLVGDLMLPLVGHAGLRLSLGVRRERSTGPFVPFDRTEAVGLLSID